MHFSTIDRFADRHLGPNEKEVRAMLSHIGIDSLDQLISETVPPPIHLDESLELPKALSEYEYLQMIRATSKLNKVYLSCIGMGYYDSITPAVIQRNIFENPGWYTQYTPYQAEISQGRLEALLNFQTVVCDLTAMPIANASLLDEGTAASEAMSMIYHTRNKGAKSEPVKEFLVSDKCFPQTINVLESKAIPLGISLLISDPSEFEVTEKTLGALVQYPDVQGHIGDHKALAEQLHKVGAQIVFAADILSLTLLTPPGELGADVVIGNTQRFGVPMGYGGPHAAYFATTEQYKRQVPGRIIGVSVDTDENPAYRMALQTREQHIRREKATSNICTAQALLAIMAGAYAVYHGPERLKGIAERIHKRTVLLEKALTGFGWESIHSNYFDTLTIKHADKEMRQKVIDQSNEAGVNFRLNDREVIGISLNETIKDAELEQIVAVFADVAGVDIPGLAPLAEVENSIKKESLRTSPYMTHEVFQRFQTETKMLRYLKHLENKDLSLTSSMIPLGSCTMKLNATTQMMPLSWPEFADMHPFVPIEQAQGYQKVIRELGTYLTTITGLHACSLQPNSGAQGEYTGLMVIQAYHQDNGDKRRDLVLIPSSAHGTNPASAVSAGMQVMITPCDKNGNIDLDDLREKATENKDRLAALMVTYPSTHGVFEESIIEVCKIIHDNGGQVYMDGANMNAQVGLTHPGKIGVDVCHLNLHKTFAIPHGGGGPGMGPICVGEHLAPYLPSHPLLETGGEKAIPAVASAPWSSASILLISYSYVRMLGQEGCTEATRMAILNANYIMSRLKDHYPILYTGAHDRVAHELIVDCRQFKQNTEIEAEDIAKRLIDYGFHAPTLSFPVAGTFMIEPTESESKEELDRFCEAMIAVREEIQEIMDGKAEVEDNVLKNAPHTAWQVSSNNWDHSYSREKAAYPLSYLRQQKFWSPVGRVNNPYGDRNLICTCPPIEDYLPVEA